MVATWSPSIRPLWILPYSCGVAARTNLDRCSLLWLSSGGVRVGCSGSSGTRVQFVDAGIFQSVDPDGVLGRLLGQVIK